MRSSNVSQVGFYISTTDTQYIVKTTRITEQHTSKQDRSQVQQHNWTRDKTTFRWSFKPFDFGLITVSSLTCSILLRSSIITFKRFKLGTNSVCDEFSVRVSLDANQRKLRHCLFHSGQSENEFRFNGLDKYYMLDYKGCNVCRKRRSVEPKLWPNRPHAWLRHKCDFFCFRLFCSCFEWNTTFLGAPCLNQFTYSLHSGANFTGLFPEMNPLHQTHWSSEIQSGTIVCIINWLMIQIIV